MQVFQPKQELFKYKGYSVVLESYEKTEDYKKFEDEAFILRTVLWDALRSLYGETSLKESKVDA